MPLVINANHCPVCDCCWHAGATCSCLRQDAPLGEDAPLDNRYDPETAHLPVAYFPDEEILALPPPTIVANAEPDPYGGKDTSGEALPLPVLNFAAPEDPYDGKNDGTNLPLPVLNFGSAEDPYHGARLDDGVLPLPRMVWE